jgi:hypothetical protein
MTLIALLHMTFESSEKSKSSAERFKSCPKIHFWGNCEEKAYIILKVPEDQKFWSDFIEKNPEKSFGGVKAQITYLKELHVPDMITISDEKIEENIAPCGSKCNTCPTLGKCSGCPTLILDTL